MALCVLCLACLAGNAPAQQIKTSKGKKKTFAAWIRKETVPFGVEFIVPIDKVWEQVPAVFTQLGFPSGPSAETDYMYLTTLKKGV